MTTPAVQRFGDAVLLQGPAVAETAYLVNLGLRWRSTVDGAAPSAHHRRLLELLNDAAEATISPGVLEDRTSDVREVPDESSLGVVIGSVAAARLLDLSPRHVTRLADHFSGQRRGGRWVFSRAAVLAEAARRKEAHAGPR